MEIESEINNINNEPIPSYEERENIIKEFNSRLKKINTKESILEISKYAANIYYKYKDFIFPDLLQSILVSAESTKKIEHLFLLIEIIKLIYSNKEKYDVKKEELFNFFEYIKYICRTFYFSFNDEFIKMIKSSLKHLKECKIYPNIFIDNLMMEFRLNTDPHITGNENDRKCLSNLVNNNILQVDYNFINLFKDIEDLERTKKNKIRIGLIKKYNDLIEKQIKLYNQNLTQIKSLNELINICDNMIL